METLTINNLKKIWKVETVRKFLKSKKIKYCGWQEFAISSTTWVYSKIETHVVEDYLTLIKVLNSPTYKEKRMFGTRLNKENIFVAFFGEDCEKYYDEDGDVYYEPSSKKMYGCFRNDHESVEDVLKNAFVEPPISVWFVVDDTLHVIYKPFKRLELTKEQSKICEQIFD